MVINMKSKATKLRKLIKSQANVSAIGLALADFYIPDIKVDHTLRRGSSYYEYHPGKNDTHKMTVSWAINDGLGGLLHEIGHAVRHHTLDEKRDGLGALFEEVDAWLWAEKESTRFGIKFDYDFADRCFADHLECNDQPKHCIRINWGNR